MVLLFIIKKNSTLYFLNIIFDPITLMKTGQCLTKTCTTWGWRTPQQRLHLPQLMFSQPLLL